LDLGKIKILHPQKHSISFGYDPSKKNVSSFDSPSVVRFRNS